ncbi:hypothetical protein PM082_002183 [Marasmius tenuissimus]|nr:hypothetical protein PM082_002183 [Marasmius tenuissimus]
MLDLTVGEDVDHLALAYDVAAGLSYLHSKRIVHGDLKGANVLVSANGKALIGDFGLSRVVETYTPGLFTSTTDTKGTTRWLSPELLNANLPCPTTESSDIYAYACVCYEIFTGKQPFYKLQHDGAVINAILYDKKHPERLEEAKELCDPMWEIMVSCWQHDQNLRPSAADVLARIGEMKNSKTGASIRTLDLSSPNHVQSQNVRRNDNGITEAHGEEAISGPAKNGPTLTDMDEGSVTMQYKEARVGNEVDDGQEDYITNEMANMPHQKEIGSQNRDEFRMLHRRPYPDWRYENLRTSGVMRHIRTRTKKKTEPCPDCDFSSVDPGTLTRHRKRIHGYVPKARSRQPPSPKETQHLPVAGPSNPSTSTTRPFGGA